MIYSFLKLRISMRKRVPFLFSLFVIISLFSVNSITFAQNSKDTNDSKDQPKTTAGKKGKIYSDGKTTFATSTTKFRIDINDNLSDPDYIEYRIDEGDFLRYSAPFSIEKDGKHTISYRGVDKVGNKEKDRSFEIIIDNTPPEVSIPNSVSFVAKGEEKFLSMRSKISLMATDELSGVKRIQYSIDNGEFKDYTEPFLPEKEGKVQIKYRAEDNLGNTTEEKILDVTIDGKAPSVSIKADKDLVVIKEKNYTKKNNNFSIVATDDSSGIVRVLVKATGDSEFREYTGPISFTAAGEKSIEAKAIDRVGNESEVVRLSFIIDDTPPETKLIPEMND